MEAPRLLIIETSGRAGSVALAEGERLLDVRLLDEARRHARDLAPAVAGLLASAGWKPRDVHGVLVSRGPGSYTGLRVGIISAKTFAFATGCALLGIETFAAVALQAPAEAAVVDVIADAQQDRVYAQRFVRRAGAPGVEPASTLQIVSAAEWLAGLGPDVWVTGPGLRAHRGRLPEAQPAADPDRWAPRPESLVRVGLARYARGERDDVWALEPLYLRPK